jgi:hypothetical protein
VKVCKECCNNQQHKFLAAEGVKQCAMCNHDLCQFCVWMEEGGEAMCFERKQQNLVVEDVSMGEDNLSEQEMRRYLRIECNANLPAVASFTQVLTLYQQYKRQLLFSTAISNVKYPLLPTSCLDPLHLSSNSIKQICTVNVRHLVRIFLNMEIPGRTQIELVHLLATLTEVEPCRNKEPLSVKC